MIGIGMTPDRASDARPTLARTLLENVEALAIAVVMALILKYFLIEAYKIPTGSMQPGIMGDPVADISDRVLVNKLVYLLRDPERYEVVVFKNPLWERQNYIKRLVGFGGERICLRNGDVFVTPKGGSEAIARKPDEIWRSVRKELLPRHDGDVDLTKVFQVESGGAHVAADRITIPTEPNGECRLRTKDPIRDHYLDGYHEKWTEAYALSNSREAAAAKYARVVGNDVSDLEIAADVTPAMDAKQIVFEIREHGRTFVLELPVASGKDPGQGAAAGRGLMTCAATVDGDTVAWEEPAADASLPALRPGVTTHVSFRNVDDELVAELEGHGCDAVLRRKYRTKGVDPDRDPTTRAQLLTHVAIRTSGSFALDDLGLWRDIHYLPDGDPNGGSPSENYTIPDDEFMVLGDNTQNSWDCRQWKRATYTFKDGATISGNYFNDSLLSDDSEPVNSESNPWSRGSDIHFRNDYGQEYVFPRTDLRGDDVDPEWTNVHSVPKKLLLGKALAVFWPLPPFSSTWRFKWVR